MDFTDKQGCKWWLITTSTLDGPWHVASQPGKKQRNIEAKPRGAERSTWHIVNTETGETKYIGPVTDKGFNYFDEARDTAKTRNDALKAKETHA